MNRTYSLYPQDTIHSTETDLVETTRCITDRCCSGITQDKRSVSGDSSSCSTTNTWPPFSSSYSST